MTRFKAATTHLLISTALASIVICLIVFGWYPLPFFFALGGPMLIALIVGIDVVLGPLMTMILFNPNKSRRALTIDLTLIGIVQLGALVYGMHSGYVGRMAYVVFVENTFRLVEASELAPNLMQKAQDPEFKYVPFAGYRVVGTTIPDTEQAKSDLTFFKAIGAGAQHMPQFYVPLSMNREQMLRSAIARETLEKKRPGLVNSIQTALNRSQLSWTDIVVLPFDLPTATWTAVVNLKNMALLEIYREPPR